MTYSGNIGSNQTWGLALRTTAAVMIWTLFVDSSVLRALFCVMCSQRCSAEAGRRFPWLTGATAIHTAAAHLIISAGSNTLVFSPLAARLFRLIYVVYGYPASASLCDFSSLCNFCAPTWFILFYFLTFLARAYANSKLQLHSHTQLCLNVSLSLTIVSPIFHCPLPEQP